VNWKNPGGIFQTGAMDDHPYYLRQRPNTFPVVPVSTLSAPIASSNIVRSQLPTVADLAGEPRIQFSNLSYLVNEDVLCYLAHVAAAAAAVSVKVIEYVVGKNRDAVA